MSICVHYEYEHIKKRIQAIWPLSLCAVSSATLLKPLTSQGIWMIITCESSHMKSPVVPEVNTTKNANRTDFATLQNIWF